MNGSVAADAATPLEALVVLALVVWAGLALTYWWQRRKARKR